MHVSKRQLLGQLNYTRDAAVKLKIDVKTAQIILMIYAKYTIQFLFYISKFEMIILWIFVKLSTVNVLNQL